MEQLAVGMVVARDVSGTTGSLLLKGGVPVTEAIKLRLQAIASYGGSRVRSRSSRRTSREVTGERKRYSTRLGHLRLRWCADYQRYTGMPFRSISCSTRLTAGSRSSHTTTAASACLARPGITVTWTGRAAQTASNAI